MSAQIHYHPGYWKCHTQEIVRNPRAAPQARFDWFCVGLVCGLLWAGTIFSAYGIYRWVRG